MGGDGLPRRLVMRLRWRLTDLAGAPLSGIFIGHLVPGIDSGAPSPGRTTQQGQVTIPNNDSRTGQLQVSMYEPTSGICLDGAAKICVQALYGPHLVLWGIVLQPTGDFDAGTVLSTLHDSSIRLKHRYLRYGDTSVSASLADGAGIPLDGTGVRTLIADAERPGGSSPGLGIVYVPGVDDVHAQPALVGGTTIPVEVDFTGDTTSASPVITGITDTSTLHLDQLVSGDGITVDLYILSIDSGTQITLDGNVDTGRTGGSYVAGAGLYVGVARGDCIYDDVQDMTDAADGFEIDFVPFDADHASPSGATWAAGDMCEIVTKPTMGTDRSQGNADGNAPVVFVHGRGGFHCVVAPDANQLRNYSVQTEPGGPTDPDDVAGIALVHDFDSEDDVGLWEDFSSADNTVGIAVLTNRAKAIVTAYAQVPKYTTATCDNDSPCGYQFMEDFFVGDIVTVFARKGYCQVLVNMRITQAQINQIDSNGNVSLALTIVPALTAGAGLTVG